MAFAWRRARVGMGRLIALALLVLIATAGVGILQTVTTAGVTAGSDRMLEAAAPDARTMRIAANGVADLDDVDQRVRAAVTASYGTAPVRIDRRESAIVTDDGGRVWELLADAGATERAELTAGAWPVAAGETAILKPAAEATGVSIGDVIRTAGDDLRITGIWQPQDDTDPAWAGDPAVSSGRTGDAAGPLLVTEDSLRALSMSGRVEWIIAPTELSAAGIDAYRSGTGLLDRVPKSVDPESSIGLSVSGDLGSTLARIDRAGMGTRAIALLPLAVVLVLAAIVLGFLVLSLAQTRRVETDLLRARGASAPATARDAVTELLVVTGVAAGIGVGIVTFIASAWQVAPRDAVMPAALVAGVLVTVALVVGGSAAARRPFLRERTDSDRATVIALATPLLIVAAVAVVSYLQLQARGGIVAPDGSADLFALLAPVLLLLTAALVIVVIAGPLAAVAARAARRSRGLGTALMLRRISRSSRTLTAALLCLSLAAGIATIGAILLPAMREAQATAQYRTLGADVRATFPVQPGGDASAAQTVADAFGDEASVALSGPATVGAEAATALAVPRTQADALADPAALVGLEDASERRIPVVFGGVLADRLGARPGDQMDVRLTALSKTVPVTVIGVVPTVAGAGDRGVLMDLAVLQKLGVSRTGVVPQPTSVWVHTDDPAAAAAQLRALSAVPVQIRTALTDTDAPVRAPVMLALLAGIGLAAVIAAAGFTAVMSAVARERRADEPALRSLGVTPRSVRAAARGEIVAVAGFAVVAGAIAGAAVAVAIVPLLGGAL
ncbi:FtsX-like permease family protein [Microbacterium sp. ZW T5_56]|uniref:FtsX-like permease family protein n=1 Tax=Microbacterium sp. ZW T5_56 TaxID=3378081 RepID=UPI0038546BA6